MDETAAMRAVGRAVRSLRAGRGWSIDQLGQRAGVSKGALVAVEKATSNPSLGTLVRLADALGVPVTALVQESPDARVRVVDTGTVEPLWNGPNGGMAVLALSVSHPAPVELWRWRLSAGERYDSHPHPHGVTETVTVVAGELRLTVGGEETVVPTWASATYAGDQRHAYEGAEPDGCELLMTVHLPIEGTR